MFFQPRRRRRPTGFALALTAREMGFDILADGRGREKESDSADSAGR